MNPSVDQAKQNPTPQDQPMVIGRDWMVISILSLAVAALWIGYGVYQVLNTSTVPAPEQSRLTLFSPDLDEKVIDILATRRQLSGQTIDEHTRVTFASEGEKTTQAAPAAPAQPPLAPLSVSPVPTVAATPTGTGAP